jgi:hypothetical protein
VPSSNRSAKTGRTSDGIYNSSNKISVNPDAFAYKGDEVHNDQYLKPKFNNNLA